METDAPNKLQIPPSALWQKLVDRSLSSRVFRFDEPAWRDITPPSGEAVVLPNSLFQIKCSAAPKWMGDLTREASADAWFTSNAKGTDVVYADTELMLEANRTGRWAQIGAGASLAQIARGDRLAMSNGTTWYISLGDISGIVALGWPCDPIEARGELIALTPKVGASPEWMLIYDETWQAATYAWQSPWLQVLQGHESPPRSASEAPRLIARVLSRPRPMLEEAAQQAFWQFSSTALGVFCAFKGVRVATGAPLIDKLFALISCTLPQATEQEVLTILRKRIVTSSGLDLLLAEHAEELVDEKDRGDFNKEMANWKASSREASAFKEAWVKRRRAATEAAAQG